ncbi:ArgS-related anticodon-binding protein NrtL [Streptomyces erythrochromogenes]|uniref:ArgS-related anticodon-binding protein NrtL n=1 Tax=Streptomyces erythrochromogenes TaxID=285574 RepID=UPI0004CDC90F|nr:DALR anticodon-binding domain-containing protein [Streptomyces erythrochromogenes]
MTPADLSRCVVRAVRCAVADGELVAGAAVPERVVVERTRPGGVGDYATPVAFQVAKAAGRPPRDVAGVLARRLGAEPGIERVEVTGAGFLNFVLPAPSAPAVITDAIIRDIVIRDVRGGAAHVVPADESGLGLRERVVRRSVLRLLCVQGGAPTETVAPVAPVAPVAKRDGDVLARYGADAACWAMLTTPARETPSFCDAQLLVQGEASEFFRVRYAHARSRALVRNAEQLGFHPEAGDVDDAPALLRLLADHPLVLEAAAHHRAPERLTRNLVELADALLDFQYRVLPQGDEKPSAAHRARLALAEAAGTVLAGGLALLGMDAPERL